MSDPDKKEDAPVPAWQQQQPNDGSTLDHARLFLQDEEVRQASREKKITFLRSKGVSDADIETLLGDDESSSGTSSTSHTTAATPASQEEATAPQSQPQPQPQSQIQQQQQQQQPLQQQSQPAQKSDQPPIVTYPEFLTKPPRPPPLITATTFLNTASAFAGLATLIIGTSKYVLSPMVESLTDARIDLHRTASGGLSRSIEKLESIVSEVPPLPVASAQDKTGRAAKRTEDHDAASSDGGDPTELFHRDVGVQTSPPQTPSATATQKPSSIESQATRLAKLTASVREMSASYATTAETHESTSAVLGNLAADVDKLRTPVATRPAGTVYYRAFSEPDDQVKAVKQSIRGVKGVLLSARSFPPPQGSTVR
ncbi:hypothetical protein PpBr36_08059 [Pyricularia pennisetigena]|uniref:hypothetical protein n=1 Tax=Pyricularia pennisetigena TaxID=1578925 RepID=UPI001154B67F|nr:hypothetical protein PpBr36_08059 [Pyricularia pennisetigena]TLS24851.1 hypothetical protein PpBr36_08059 [Pyricularia pennisetigena]